MANLVLAVIGVAASGMGVARRTWRRVAGASVLAAWWLFRRARKERQHVVAGAGRGSLSLNATATATVTRVPAPRSSVDDLATYVDDVVARLEEERRLIDSRIVIERDERTTAVAEVSRDLDEIAVSGIHLGAWGVALLVAGTALTLIAAWV
ncbi:MAG: hypothetical protein M0010_14455 [Actinomycetota bacterium]|nr:hypothetical protein [Actinomycetota bacterium]